MPRRTWHYRTVSFFLLCVAVTALGQGPNKFPFKRQEMPFNAPAVERPIDRDCGAEGTANGPAQEAQNIAKNDFSAKGDPVPMLVTDFDRLEKATLRARICAAEGWSNCRKVKLSAKLPVDRDQLKDIAATAGGATVGEGTLVVLEAKVLESHYSNTKFNIYGFTNGKPNRGGGESVNCKGVPNKEASAGIDRNDLHVVLVAPGVTKQCLSVTAEISPHFRPDSWRRFHDMGKNSLGEDVNTAAGGAKGVNFKKLRKVRVTGTLFYDSIHEPCAPGKPASPARRSSWEIHPVYKLDVQTLSGQWMSFDDWAATQ